MEWWFAFILIICDVFGVFTRVAYVTQYHLGVAFNVIAACRVTLSPLRMLTTPINGRTYLVFFDAAERDRID
jgi:hypothetical protein